MELSYSLDVGLLYGASTESFRDITIITNFMMPKKPLVSVVIPVFNGSSFVARAVDSVLAQTCKDFEIIIVDDGSTDDTQAVLAQFANQPNMTCLYQENAGPAQARNSGIKSASGEYIAFLDCDDIWFPEKMEQQLAILRRNTKPGLVHANYEVIDPRGRVIKRARAGRSCEPLHVAFTGGQAPTLSAVIVRRVLLEQVGGFDPNLFVSEDSDLGIRLHDVARFECIDRVLVHKFRQIHGYWDIPCDERTHCEKVLSSRERFLTRLQSRPILNKQQLGALNREWSGYYVMKGTFEERQGRWVEARKQYLAAIQKEPFRLRGYSRFLRAVRL